VGPNGLCPPDQNIGWVMVVVAVVVVVVIVGLVVVTVVVVVGTRARRLCTSTVSTTARLPSRVGLVSCQNDNIDHELLSVDMLPRLAVTQLKRPPASHSVHC